MRILVVSRAWPSSERSGVSLAAAAHVQMLVELGHEVSIVGAFAPVLEESLPVRLRLHVQTSGSGALYAPARVQRGQLDGAILRAQPDLVIVEAWQTALTDAAVEAAFDLGVPVLMVSHGVSLHPFSTHWPDRLRAWGWSAYRMGRLPRLVAKLSAITTLAEQVSSPRFHDRDIAIRLGIPVSPLANFPVHWGRGRIPFDERKKQLLLVGYFSPVKNQLAALDVLSHLPPDLTMRFIGPKRGAYHARCVARADALGLSSRVMFSEDHECDIARELATSIAVLSTSVTEALPICLLEAMASGTPFVATPVGAVPALGAGAMAADQGQQVRAVLELTGNATLWEQQSLLGLVQHETRFSRGRIKDELAAAVALAHRIGPRGERVLVSEKYRAS